MSHSIDRHGCWLPLKKTFMKRILLIFAFATCFVACGNNASTDQSAGDSANNVVLPENRSSDTLAFPSDSSGTTPGGVKSDTMKN